MLSLPGKNARLLETPAQHLSRAFWLLLFIALAAIALYARLPSGAAMGDLLWAEDGTVFLAHAYELGFKSLFTPYAGYLHVYPRLVSLVVVSLGLSSAPFVFLAAWLLAVICFLHVVRTRLIVLGLSQWQIIVVSFLILLQPGGKEVFFTLTNAQWFLGAALAIMICVDDLDDVGVAQYAFLLLASLTGPFAILVLPALFIRVIFDPMIKQGWRVAAILLPCSLIQAYLLATSERIRGIADPDLTHWVRAFSRVFTFATGGISIIAALAFWGIVFVALRRSWKRNGISLGGALPQMAICLCVFVFYFAGLWSHKSAPLALSPIGGGDRYFFIPYSLAFFAVFWFLSKGKAHFFLLASFFLALVCLVQFKPVMREAVNFPAFVEFSQSKSGVSIPLNPVWPQYPGWSLQPLSPQRDVAAFSLSLDRSSESTEDSALPINREGSEITTRVTFKRVDQCPGSKYLGVSFELERDGEGWAKVFWSHGETSFREIESLRRFYPAGKVRMDFALPHSPTGTVISFDPMDNQKAVRILRAEAHCL